MESLIQDSDNGKQKVSNCHTSIETKPLNQLSTLPDILFILSPFNAEEQIYKDMQSLINQTNNKQSIIAGVGKGIQWLHEFQLLGQNYVTNGIIEISKPSHVNIKQGLLYSIQQNRVLCVGGAACLDMTLKLISILHNRELSIQTAEKLYCPLIRSAKHNLHKLHPSTNNWPEPLLDVYQLMINNLKEPLKITEICKHLSLTNYQIHQMFKQHIGIPPTKFYYNLRLMRVHSLLKESDLSISDIAKEAGYTNLSTLYKRFKERFGAPPVVYKKSSSF